MAIGVAALVEGRFASCEDVSNGVVMVLAEWAFPVCIGYERQPAACDESVGDCFHCEFHLFGG